MDWVRSFRADPRAAAIADRHYNRQAIGSAQFVPPGRCLVLLTRDCGALWVTSWPKAEFVKHAWAGAWINSCFRREQGGLASDLILEAVAVTRHRWPDIPALGMVTFIDRDKVRPTMRRGKPIWGYSYLQAGFRQVGETVGGLLAFQLLPADMPPPAPPFSRQRMLAL